MYKKALMLTYSEDRHAEEVTKELVKRRVDVYRIDTEYLIDKYKLKFDLETRLFSISDGKRTETIDESWVIWNRRLSDPNLPEMSRDLKEIVYEETTRTWDGLLFSAPGKTVNRPQAHYSANNKIHQLIYARNHGIKTPDTIVTNSPEDVKDFYKTCSEKNKRMCHKLQKVAIVAKEDKDLVTYTNLVEEKNLEYLDLIKMHPNLFQDYSEKQFEVRVTALEDRAIGIAIHSQDSDMSRIDFRRYDFENVKYEHIELPEKIEKFCTGMLKEHDIFFGEFDFIYDKNGEYCFLELNPNGQWLWLEVMSKYNLTKPFVDNLLK